MTCWICGRKLRQDDYVVQVHRVIENERRGDFVTSMAVAYLHLHHVKENP